MDVHVEVQGPAEPWAPTARMCAVGWESLDHRDRAAARLLEARGTRVLPQRTKHGADEHGGHPATQIVVPRQPVSQPVR